MTHQIIPMLLKEYANVFNAKNSKVVLCCVCMWCVVVCVYLCGVYRYMWCVWVCNCFTFSMPIWTFSSLQDTPLHCHGHTTYTHTMYIHTSFTHIHVHTHLSSSFSKTRIVWVIHSPHHRQHRFRGGD